MILGSCYLLENRGPSPETFQDLQTMGRTVSLEEGYGFHLGLLWMLAQGEKRWVNTDTYQCTLSGDIYYCGVDLFASLTSGVAGGGDAWHTFKLQEVQKIFCRSLSTIMAYLSFIPKFIQFEGFCSIALSISNLDFVYHLMF
jgi:hypothetical protein